jgi:hypothetical protein
VYVFYTSLHTPLIRFLRAVLIHGNLSLAINNVGQSHYSWGKETAYYIPKTSVDRSAGLHPVSLPFTTIEAVEKTKHLLVKRYISLLDPYLQHVISMFNNCSRWATHRSLINIGESYNLRSASFPHHSPLPFPTDSPPLFPNGPARSQFNMLNIKL